MQAAMEAQAAAERQRRATVTISMAFCEASAKTTCASASRRDASKRPSASKIAACKLLKFKIFSPLLPCKLPWKLKLRQNVNAVRQ
jgi:hypothetical protein